MNNINIQDDVDLYKIFNLPVNASKDDLRKSYKKLILKFHPDKNRDKNSKEEFIKVKQAYDILINKKIENNFKNNSKINFLKLLFEINFKNINFLKILKILEKKINFKNFKINQIFDIIKNKSFLDIELNINFSIKEYYYNEYKTVNYVRTDLTIFTENIFPIDKKQIYENEGEILHINNNTYHGHVKIYINIINEDDNDLRYEILNNDLYIKIDHKNIINSKIKVKFVDGKIYNFSIEEIEEIELEFGKLYKIENLGLPYYDINKENSDIIDIRNSLIKRGNLFFVL